MSVDTRHFPGARTEGAEWFDGFRSRDEGERRSLAELCGRGVPGRYGASTPGPCPVPRVAARVADGSRVDGPRPVAAELHVEAVMPPGVSTPGPAVDEGIRKSPAEIRGIQRLHASLEFGAAPRWKLSHHRLHHVTCTPDIVEFAATSRTQGVLRVQGPVARCCDEARVEQLLLMAKQDPLEGPNDIGWAELGHAYGSAADVPDQLRSLRSAEPQQRAAARSTGYRLR